ncbi:hypothetical protein GCM10027290_15700 [Micromonospora sonneratiae]|uniref:Helix-turn-helix domain-containing protein n=1 Tax=Micromonospora sonneratiae TaxID=1184706 RepID=A0ABW3Y845_9ACTN
MAFERRRAGRQAADPSPTEPAQQTPLAALAGELRKLRERSGMSLRELERSTFASDSALSRYFSGRGLPPWRVVEALCAQAGVDPERLRPGWERAQEAKVGTKTKSRDRMAQDAHHFLVRSFSAIQMEANAAVNLAKVGGGAALTALLTIQAACNAAIRDLRAASDAATPPR